MLRTIVLPNTLKNSISKNMIIDSAYFEKYL